MWFHNMSFGGYCIGAYVLANYTPYTPDAIGHAQVYRNRRVTQDDKNSSNVPLPDLVGRSWGPGQT